MPLRRRPSWDRREEDIERAGLDLLRVRLGLEDRLRWAVTRASAAGGSCMEGAVSWLLGLEWDGIKGRVSGRGGRTATFRSLRSARIWAICSRGGGFVVVICGVVWFLFLIFLG
jgi:hypothetical protein